MIHAIIYDFGRVITAAKPASLFRQYEEELGLAAGVLNRTMFGSSTWQDLLIGRCTKDAYWSEVGPQLGLTSQEAIAAFRRRYRDDEAVNTGVVELIRQQRGRFRLAVLSNAPPGLIDWLEEWGLAELFDVVVCSGDEGVAKPDAGIFLRTLERLGVAAHEAVFVDDTLRHVQAARALGIHAINFESAQLLAAELSQLLDVSTT